MLAGNILPAAQTARLTNFSGEGCNYLSVFGIERMEGTSGIKTRKTNVSQLVYCIRGKSKSVC